MSKQPSGSGEDDFVREPKGKERIMDELPPFMYPTLQGGPSNPFDGSSGMLRPRSPGMELPPLQLACVPQQALGTATGVSIPEEEQSLQDEGDNFLVPGEFLANRKSHWNFGDELRLYQLAESADFSKPTWHKLWRDYNDKQRVERSEVALRKHYEILYKREETVDSLKQKVDNLQQSNTNNAQLSRCSKIDPNKIPWSADDDAKLLYLVNKHPKPTSWQHIIAKEYNDGDRPHRTSDALKSRYAKLAKNSKT